MHINPDHYLETSTGRLWTSEKNSLAWEKCFLDLEAALKQNQLDSDLYILIGCQGSGKSTWAKNHLCHSPNSIIFDAILVKETERAPILKLAKQYNKTCIAVYFQTPLATCLQRNKQRPLDEIVNEQALINVYSAIEMPDFDEGFRKIINII